MNDYFCVLPFFGYEFGANGSTSHCCLLSKKYDIELLRADMLANTKSEFCNACWSLEDKGLPSDRQLKNSTLDFYWDRDIEYIKQDAKSGNFKTLMVKNYTSNTCNSTCVTCSSNSSSAWAPLEKKAGIIPVIPVTMTKSDIIKNLDFKNLITLNLIGGEPLYEKLNFFILEQLLENNNTTCFIQITTNGSVGLTDSQKTLLSRFRNINVNLSIDGTEKVFEYLRYPLKWNDLLTQLDFFRTVTDNVSVSHTTSNLNLIYYHETIDWFAEQKLQYHFNPVSYPACFRPAALPIEIKEKIIKKYPSQAMNFFIGDVHTDQDDIDFMKMLDIISVQDKVKNISFKEFLPDLAKLLSAD